MHGQVLNSGWSLIPIYFYDANYSELMPLEEAPFLGTYVPVTYGGCRRPKALCFV